MSHDEYPFEAMALRQIRQINTNGKAFFLAILGLSILLMIGLGTVSNII